MLSFLIGKSVCRMCTTSVFNHCTMQIVASLWKLTLFLILTNNQISVLSLMRFYFSTLFTVRLNLLMWLFIRYILLRGWLRFMSIGISNAQIITYIKAFWVVVIVIVLRVVVIATSIIVFYAIIPVSIAGSIIFPYLRRVHKLLCFVHFRILIMVQLNISNLAVKVWLNCCLLSMRIIVAVRIITVWLELLGKFS